MHQSVMVTHMRSFSTPESMSGCTSQGHAPHGRGERGLGSTDLEVERKQPVGNDHSHEVVVFTRFDALAHLASIIHIIAVLAQVLKALRS